VWVPGLSTDISSLKKDRPGPDGQLGPSGFEFAPGGKRRWMI
jgi:hypothetical protein